MNIAGVVVLYNPCDDIIDNIKTYLPILKMLYVVDNSTKEIKSSILKHFESEKKIEYIKMNGNEGIGKALKVGVEKAILDKFDWVLTMDQDSKYPTEDFIYIKDYLDTNDYSNIGLITINYSSSGIKSDGEKSEIQKINTNISSGMILNLKNYQKIDGFNEELFIDYVDYDICYQMRKNNFEVILFKNIMLDHELGDTEIRKFLFFKKNTIWHSDVRYYYGFRNYYYLKKYKKQKYLPGIIKELTFKNLLFYVIYSKNKLKTMKFIFRGIRDGKKGILGQYKEKNKG